jgi:hypothetical protein
MTVGFPQQPIAPGMCRATMPSMSPADGDLQWPGVSHDGVTEIFVHGVGGAAPAGMLDALEVRQVTGDRISGMWRSLAGTPGGNGTHREAYSWGGLTRRPLATAIWLLLLPFALANIAGWMAAAGGPCATSSPWCGS